MLQPFPIRSVWRLALFFLIGLLVAIPTGSALAVPPGIHVDASYTSTNCGGHIWGVDAFATIQEGVNAAGLGWMVYVAPGTYVESNILVSQDVTIEGTGISREDVIVVPAAEDANVDNAFGSSAQNCFIIRANNVTIRNLTINGRGNPLLTVGKNNYRIGIVTADATYPGGGGGSWSNLHVDNVVVRHVYRRGISVFPRTNSGTIVENCRVDSVAYNHGLYLCGPSQALNNTITHCFQGIVFDLDATSPLGTNVITGNTLSQISNFPGCWGWSAPSTYNGQPRAIQFNCSDPACRPVEIRNNVIDDIGSTGGVGTVGVYMRLGDTNSELTGNTITLTSDGTLAQNVGLLLGWSYAKGYLVSGNTINSGGTGMGMMVHAVGSAGDPMEIEGNTLTGTSSTHSAPGDGTGIYVSNHYLFAPQDSTGSYITVSDGNTITGYARGIDMDRHTTVTKEITANIHGNTISGNVAGIVATSMVNAVDATSNWWGTANGPAHAKNVFNTGSQGNSVTNMVTYVPWLDAPPQTGVDYGPITNNDVPTEFYSNFTDAIAGTTAGGTITAAAGTFTESSTITKALTLNGAKAGVDARTRNTASGESIIDGTGLPAAQHDGMFIANGVSNVVIDGFEFSNWYLATTLNGDGNAISSYCMSADTLGASNVTILNNYIHDVGYNGILVGSENARFNSMTVQSGWIIQMNLIEDFTYAGIELTNVTQAQVLDNTIAAPSTLFNDPGDAGVGIEIAARSRTKPVVAGTNSLVQGNTITGSFVAGSRAAVNLLSRTYQAASNATLGSVTVDNNTITGATNVRAGVLAVAESRNNGPATIATLAITNNTLDGNNQGVELHNYVKSGSGTATHSNVTITGNSLSSNTTNGVHLMAATSGAGVTVSSNSILLNGLYGIRHEGSGTLAATCNWFGETGTSDVESMVSGSVTFVPFNISAVGPCTGGPVKVIHLGSVASVHTTIQAGVTAALPGDSVLVEPGTFAGSVTINKELHLVGAGQSQTSVTSSGTTPAITVTANNVVISDLTITNASQLVEGVRINGATSGLLVERVDFTNLGNNPGPGNAYGIQVMTSFSGLVVNQCRFIATNLGAYSRAMGIFAPANSSHANFDIRNSTFEYFFTGVDIRSQIDGLLIRNNTFGPQELQDCQAAAAGVYMGDGPNGNFDISNVVIDSNLFTSFARGVYVYNYATGEAVNSFQVKDNMFLNSIYSSPVRFIGRTTTFATLEGPIVIDGNGFVQSSPIVNGNGVAMIDIRGGLESATSDLQVTNNVIDFHGPFSLSTWGMLLRGPVANATISGNTMTGGDAGGASAGMPATSGIVLQTDFTGFGPMSSSADIVIDDNSITGFVNGVTAYDFVNGVYGGIPLGANVAVHDNDLSANTWGVRSDATGVIDATSNWWGSATGPSHPGDVCALGDSVSDHVTYSPWYTDIAMTTLKLDNSFTISGTARYMSMLQQPLSGLRINLHLDTTLVASQVTTTVGEYAFNGLYPGNYTLSIQSSHPTGNWATWGGVNATDFLMTQRHATGAALMPTSPALIQLSANVVAPGTPTINAADATAIRNAYLTNKPQNYFATQKWIITEGNAPGTMGGPKAHSYNSAQCYEFPITLGCASDAHDYFGRCAGDVDGSFIPVTGPKKDAPAFVTLTHDGLAALTAGGTIDVPVLATQPMTLGALSLMFTPVDGLTIVGARMAGSADAMDLERTHDETAVYWASTTAVQVAADEPVLWLTVAADANVAMNEPLSMALNGRIENELADANGSRIPDARLVMAKLGSGVAGMSLTMHPNPVRDVSTVTYTLPGDGSVRIALYDVTGREVAIIQNAAQTAGTHAAMFTASNLPVGTYLLRMTVATDRGSETRTQSVIVAR